MSIALYIHIPFCLRKCQYCDFYSIPVESQDIDGFIQALRRELGLYAAQLPEEKRRLQSVYLGGGTPTCLSTRNLACLLDDCRQRFDWLPEAEVTIEANPGTLDQAKLEYLLAAGVNRLSLGVQTFDDRLLRNIGRIHSAEQAIEAYEMASQAGFANINLDLMYGLPGQTLADWESTVKLALEMAPAHLSAYSLKIEPGTPFGERYARGELCLPDEDEEAAMYKIIIDQAVNHGYVHYEISNFARPGREARHNLTYWLNQEYLGVGPAAHSYVGGVRWANLADLDAYRATLASGLLPIAERETITPELERAETMFLGLRLLRGVSRSEWWQRFGLTLEEAYPTVIPRLLAQGLLSDHGDRLALTRRGLFIANDVFAAFLP
ncbi:MAG: radical SAM family heme chaperone HemW [Firmicutes bacterium]|nr:radical SAM family heme chaperone HemW [Bacillota bacterium]